MALFGLLSDNGPLSSPDAQLALAAGLLSGKGNWGANLSQGLLAANSAQQQERANRQSDLQQLTGAYQMLKQQEFAKMLAAKQSNTPYSPNPMLPQMEQRLAQLTGLPNLANQGPVASRVPPAPPIAQSPASGMQQMPMQGPQGAPQQIPGPGPASPGDMQRQPMQPQQSQAPQQDSSGLGGPAGGIPMEAWLAQDTTGASYLKQLAEDNKPIVLRQGDLVGKGPGGKFTSLYQQPQSIPGVLPNRDNNGQVTSFHAGPGFAEAASGIRGAETGAIKGAEAPFDFRNVTTASGSSVPMSVSQLMGNNKAPQGPSGVAQLTVTQPSKQAQAVPNAKDDPWAAIPQRYQPQGTGQSTFDRGMAENAAKAAFDLQAKYGTNAEAANQRIALNNQAASLVDKADTGPMAARIGDVKNWLTQRFGIPESSFANTPTADQTLQKDLLNAATQKAKQQFGSRMTQSEVMLMLTRGAPNVDMTKSAIKYLLQSDNAMQGYAIKQAEDFGRYISKGGDPTRFEGWYARSFPATSTLQAIEKPQASSVDDLVNKYRTR